MIYKSDEEMMEAYREEARRQEERNEKIPAHKFAVYQAMRQSAR